MMGEGLRVEVSLSDSNKMSCSILMPVHSNTHSAIHINPTRGVEKSHSDKILSFWSASRTNSVIV